MAKKPSQKRSDRRGADRRIAVSPAREPRGASQRRLLAAIGVAVLAIAGICLAWQPWRGFEPQGETDFSLTEPAFASTATADVMTEEALRVARQLAEAYPEDPGALEIAGLVHKCVDRLQEAMRYWEQCVRLRPDRSSPRRRLAEAALQTGDNPKAVEHARVLCRIAPSAESSGMLACALSKSGQPREAVEALESDRAQRGPNAANLLLLGEGYLQLNEPGKAKEALEEASQFGPLAEHPCFALGTACARLGRTEEARRWMDRFRKLRATRTKAMPEPMQATTDREAVRGLLTQIHLDAAQLHAEHGDMARAGELARRAAALKSVPLEPLATKDPAP
jgi:tetratricopeptide (TPR) repeat protein